MAAWPSGYDVERYTEEHGLDFEDITRDIVRIAAIAHLLDAGILDGDFVVTGGMTLRLRGSDRFTIKDTDSSLRGRLDELELTGMLRLDTDQLQVYPDPGTNWGRKTGLGYLPRLPPMIAPGSGPIIHHRGDRPGPALRL
jgi:hypothetical protein